MKIFIRQEKPVATTRKGKKRKKERNKLVLHQKRLAVELRPFSLGELTVIRRSPIWI